MNKLLSLLFLAMMLYFSLRVIFRPPKRPAPKVPPPDPKMNFHDAGEMVRDPVCGTYVDPQQAPWLIHQDQKFFFCGEDCKNRFLVSPDFRKQNP